MKGLGYFIKKRRALDQSRIFNTTRMNKMRSFYKKHSTNPTVDRKLIEDRIASLYAKAGVIRPD